MKADIKFGAQILRQIARQFPQELKRAEEDNLNQARAIAMSLSSGSIPTATLRRMGHPYATRAPQTPLRPEIINDQRGVFRRSWQTSGPETRFGAYVSRLTNVASYARFMLGTRKMIPRPIIDETADQLRDSRKRRIDQAIKRAFQPRK